MRNLIDIKDLTVKEIEELIKEQYLVLKQQ